jgi:hypothetical protein
MSDNFTVFPSEEKKLELLTRLKLLGAKEVTVRFQGGGDSGEIEGIEIFNGERCINVDDEKLDWPTSNSVFNEETKEFEVQTSEKHLSLESVLMSMTEEWLNHTGHDWYNNDGGQGALTIDFTQSPPKIELEVGVNYVEVNQYNYIHEEEE